MKTFNEFLTEATELNPAIKSALHPDFHKASKPQGSSSAVVKVKKADEHEVHDKIHQHLQSQGFKRNPSLSSGNSHTYQHENGSKIHVTHYSGSTALDYEK